MLTRNPALQLWLKPEMSREDVLGTERSAMLGSASLLPFVGDKSGDDSLPQLEPSCPLTRSFYKHFWRHTECQALCWMLES